MIPVLINPVQDMPRADYPRPQWMRSEWMCLNGPWAFAYDFGKSGKERGMVENGDYPMTINVPFCPESVLSGIGNIDFMPSVWYRKTFSIEKPEGKRALLHFGAVDYECEVWVNGIFCGQHKGGYSSFEMDVTAALANGENTITVRVVDDMFTGKQLSGKQCPEYRSSGCAYTRTTGIWQTVWMEFVPERYLLRSKLIPCAADGTLSAEIRAAHVKTGDRVRLTAKYDGREVGQAIASFVGGIARAFLTVSERHLWNVGSPELYDLTLELVDGESVVDTVESYFGLRDVALSDRALTINGRPVFLRTVLDQGFNPEGVYTAPTDEYLKRDIELSMDLGFNGARLHHRVFEERTLYWADRLGYLVWGESACSTNTDIGSGDGIEYFLPEWMATVERDFNHPALIGWIPFNETYHLMKLDPEVIRTAYFATKSYDSTRPVIAASGGIHYDATDMFDVHDYEQDPAKFRSYFEPMKQDPGFAHVPIDRYVGRAPRRECQYNGQPYWVSECGGTFWSPGSKGWGYGDAPKTEAEFIERYEGLIEVMASHPRICGFCYTQLYDIEQEQNGLLNYDRTPKFDDAIYDRIRRVNQMAAAVEEE